MLFVNRSPLYFACCEQQSGCIKWWREDRYDDYYYDMHEWSKICDRRGRDGVEWRCKSLDFSTFYTHTSSIHIHLTRKTCAHTDDDAGDKQSLSRKSIVWLSFGFWMVKRKPRIKNQSIVRLETSKKLFWWCCIFLPGICPNFTFPCSFLTFPESVLSYVHPIPGKGVSQI